MDEERDQEACVPAPISRRFLIFLGLVSLAWAGFCFRVSFLRWNAWDLGIDTAFLAQLFHRHSLGLGWTVTVMSEEPMEIFLFHIHMLLLPLSWLFALFPHPLTLSAVMHLAHALGAFIVGLLARNWCGGEALAGFAAALIFLLHPQLALAQTTYDFSFRHLAPALLPAAILAAAANRSRLAILLLAILVASSEELALTAAFTLFAMAIIRPSARRCYVTVGVFFLIYLAVLIFWGISGHAFGRYGHLGRSFKETLTVLANPEKGRYFLIMLGPLLGLPLWLPTPLLLAALPSAGQNLFSSTGDT